MISQGKIIVTIMTTEQRFVLSELSNILPPGVRNICCEYADPKSLTVQEKLAFLPNCPSCGFRRSNTRGLRKKKEDTCLYCHFMSVVSPSDYVRLPFPEDDQLPYNNWGTRYLGENPYGFFRWCRDFCPDSATTPPLTCRSCNKDNVACFSPFLDCMPCLIQRYGYPKKRGTPSQEEKGFKMYRTLRTFFIRERKSIVSCYETERTSRPVQNTPPSRDMRLLLHVLGDTMNRDTISIVLRFLH